MEWTVNFNSSGREKDESGRLSSGGWYGGRRRKDGRASKKMAQMRI